jgi:hypothetical protein
MESLITVHGRGDNEAEGAKKALNNELPKRRDAQEALDSFSTVKINWKT